MSVSPLCKTTYSNPSVVCIYMQTLLNCLNAYLGRLSKSMIELSFYREFVMAAIIFLSSFLLILRLRIGATGYSPGYTATGPAYSIERVTIFIKIL